MYMYTVMICHKIIPTFSTSTSSVKNSLCYIYLSEFSSLRAELLHTHTKKKIKQVFSIYDSAQYQFILKMSGSGFNVTIMSKSKWDFALEPV